MSESPEPITEPAEEISSTLAETTITPARTLESTGATKFTDLPLELREKIYEHAIRDAGLFEFPQPRLPAMCYINQKEYLASAKVLMRKAGILLRADGDAESWQGWISTIAEFQRHGLPAYTKVELNYDSNVREDNLTKDFQFLSSFTFVREFTITIGRDLTELLEIQKRQKRKPDARYMDMVWSETHKFIEKTKILQLRACASLERVVFRTPWVHRIPLSDPNLVAMLADKIAVRIKRDYIREHGRILQVIFVIKNKGQVPIEVPIGHSSPK